MSKADIRFLCVLGAWVISMVAITYSPALAVYAFCAIGFFMLADHEFGHLGEPTKIIASVAWPFSLVVLALLILDARPSR